MRKSNELSAGSEATHANADQLIHLSSGDLEPGILVESAEGVVTYGGYPDTSDGREARNYIEARRAEINAQYDRAEA